MHSKVQSSDKPPATSSALAFMTDQVYSSGFLVTLASALAVSDLEGFSIYIGHDQTEPINDVWEHVISLCKRYEFPVERCHRVEIDMNLFKNYKSFTNGTYQCYGRYYLATLLKEPTLLYLDSDMLVMDDLASLVREVPSGSKFAAVQDTGIPTHGDETYTLDGKASINDSAPYFNSGLMVTKTDHVREIDLMSLFAAFHSRISNARGSDQTYINIIAKDQWYQLPSRWNKLTSPPIPAQLFKSNEMIGVVHFVTSRKPWNQACLDAPNLLWHSVARSIGVKCSKEVSDSLNELIGQHVSTSRSLLKAKYFYQKIKNKQNKAKRSKELIDLQNTLSRVEKWLKKHGYGKLPSEFRTLTNSK